MNVLFLYLDGFDWDSLVHFSKGSFLQLNLLQLHCSLGYGHVYLRLLALTEDLRHEHVDFLEEVVLLGPAHLFIHFL